MCSNPNYWPCLMVQLGYNPTIRRVQPPCIGTTVHGLLRGGFWGLIRASSILGRNFPNMHRILMILRSLES